MPGVRTQGGASHTAPEPLTAIGQYLARIRGIPLLSREAESLLAARAASGDRDALASLVEHHLPLVVGVARRYAGGGLPLEDLIQEGNLGLLHAATKFEAARGLRFATYATWWVRQYVSRAARTMARSIRVPPTVLADLRRLEARAAEIERDLGRRPTDTALAAAMGRPAARIHFLRLIPEEPLSLDHPARDLATQASPPDGDAVNGVDLGAALRTLPARLRRVLGLRYGLSGDPPLTLREVGTLLHISRERARQLEQRALKRLRNGQVA